MRGSLDSGSEVAPGIWSISVPTPWPVGPVNAYVIDDDPLTLVDTGPMTAEAIAEIEAGLRARGRRIEDLERVIATHQHVDHWGLAQPIVDRSGAELCALEGFAAWLETYPASLAAEDRFAHDLLREHGVDDDAAGAAVYRGDDEYARSAFPARTLRDGEVLDFADRRLRVLHRPGHSPSDTVFHDEDRGILLGADHVLSWPSVAILSPPLDGSAGAGRPRALSQYMTSLRATQAMEVQVVLPGHGTPVEDHRATIAERLRWYDRMTRRVASAVAGEPRTALEIAGDVRGPIADGAAFFVLCDVLGHLDRLVDAGAVVERRGADGVTRFAAV